MNKIKPSTPLNQQITSGSFTFHPYAIIEHHDPVMASAWPLRSLTNDNIRESSAIYMAVYNIQYVSLCQKQIGVIYALTMPVHLGLPQHVINRNRRGNM